MPGALVDYQLAITLIGSSEESIKQIIKNIINIGITINTSPNFLI